MRFGLVMVVLCIVATMATAAYDFSRYQIILDREPFGSPPPAPKEGPDPDPDPPKPPPPVVRELRLCAIRENADGELRVGFVNIRKKPEKFYWLYVGETSDDGIEVVDADYGEEKAQLRKDGHEFWLEMGGVATAAAPTSKARSGSRRSPASTRTTSSRSGSSVVKPPNTSYLARLRERQEERKQRALAMLAKREAQTEEMKVAEEKRLREYNLNLIREGQPPLPIQLTKDEDDKLVKEGVLPAAE